MNDSVKKLISEETVLAIGNDLCSRMVDFALSVYPIKNDDLAGSKAEDFLTNINIEILKLRLDFNKNPIGFFDNNNLNSYLIKSPKLKEIIVNCKNNNNDNPVLLYCNFFCFGHSEYLLDQAKRLDAKFNDEAIKEIRRDVFKKAVIPFYHNATTKTPAVSEYMESLMSRPRQQGNWCSMV